MYINHNYIHSCIIIMKELYIALLNLLGQYEEPNSDSQNQHKFRMGRWPTYNSNLREFPGQDG